MLALALACTLPPMRSPLIALRSLLIALLVTAAVAGGGLALTSCGADEAAGVDAAQAAEATGKQGTARMTMRMKMSGLGLPAPMTVKADGVTALREPRARIKMDLGPLLALTGAPRETKGDLEMLIDGADFHVKPPELDGLKIPGGKSWVALDLRAVAEAAGLPADGLGALFALDPASQLRALKAAKGLDEVGKQEIGGVETTHFKGTYRVSDFIAALPDAKRAQARRALDAMKRIGGQETRLNDPTPAELWIDDDGLMRRMRVTSKVPAQAGVPAGNFVIDNELRDFGTKLDTTAPPASESYDATHSLAKALKGLPRGIR